MAEMTKNWVTRMINRHAETVLEIDKVKKHLANAGNNPKISKVTYGNLSLLLRDLKNLEDLGTTDRGDGGFGSTAKK